MKSFVTTVFAFASVIGMQAQGYIVPNGIYPNASGGLPGYEIDILQNPTNGDYTAFTLIPVGRTPPTLLYTNTFSFSYLLDEGVRVFLVAQNQPISEQAIRSGSYTELMYTGSQVFNHGVQFYLGLYTGYFPWTGSGEYTGIYQNPMFGWVRLVNIGGTIQMLDSALAYGASGILAGTQTIIPEPSGIALTVLGMLALSFYRLKKPFTLTPPPARRTGP